MSTVERSIKTDATLIERWIEPNPHHPDASNVRLREYGYSVWALIGDLPLVNGDATALAAEYEIPTEAAEAAIAYYRHHQAEIDARLARNASIFAA